MKFCFLLIGIIACCYVEARQVSDKDLKVHFKNVEKSKEKGTTIWDLDTVFISGVPYCIIIEKSNGTLMGSDYSVRSLQGKELIYVKYGYINKANTPNLASQYGPPISYYTFYFTDTQNKAQISYGTKVYKTVVKEELIQGDHINSEEEQKFISLNGMKFSQEEGNSVSEPANGKNDDDTRPVNRNRDADISIINGTISQDNKVIGSIQTAQVAENGIIVKTLSIFLPDGTKVAEAKCYGINSHDWTVVTVKDNRTWEINSTFNKDETGVVKYLIDKYYL